MARSDGNREVYGAPCGRLRRPHLLIVRVDHEDPRDAREELKAPRLRSWTGLRPAALTGFSASSAVRESFSASSLVRVLGLLSHLDRLLDPVQRFSTTARSSSSNSPTSHPASRFGSTSPWNAPRRIGERADDQRVGVHVAECGQRGEARRAPAGRFPEPAHPRSPPWAGVNFLGLVHLSQAVETLVGTWTEPRWTFSPREEVDWPGRGQAWKRVVFPACGNPRIPIFMKRSGQRKKMPALRRRGAMRFAPPAYRLLAGPGRVVVVGKRWRNRGRCPAPSRSGPFLCCSSGPPRGTRSHHVTVGVPVEIVCAYVRSEANPSSSAPCAPAGSRRRRCAPTRSWDPSSRT